MKPTEPYLSQVLNSSEKPSDAHLSVVELEHIADDCEGFLRAARCCLEDEDRDAAKIGLAETYKLIAITMGFPPYGSNHA